MSEFVDHLHTVLEPLGVISTRRMFGGHGIYHDGVMFGLVADDTLYLKADTDSAAHFEAKGLDRFGYEKHGKMIRLSFYLAPEEIFDDADVALLWGRRACDAALRAKRRQEK